jgi:glycosyltransferase involved in cell wall biosynthesis/peptidoglycan/xylan/chitin deacetylase (PgdA/CDA1 family)
MLLSKKFHSIYFHLKPFIPRRVQIAFRSKLILSMLPYTDVWPIDGEACTPPDGWSGWPDGKQFALIIAHDVEAVRGYKRCNDLVQLEKRLGFRSSFNFVAEDYYVSTELRDYLTSKEFEVGLHGLNHKGNMYKTKKIFQSQLIKINKYLKEWGAVGFRSPSMFHNLEWIHDLNIEYDASTFDTDPFEPQPDGMKTIFPFWVQSNDNHKGYVELPYTLPQDHTLFVLMKERTIDIWKKKVEWIAQHGGMVFLNAHPDYMCFDSKKPKIDEYPVKLYIEILEYIKTKFKGQYWHVLPKDIARFCRENKSQMRKLPDEKVRRPRRRICMLAYSFYDTDNRIKRYAESLVKHDYDVDIISLRKNDYDSFETVNGVNIYRIQKRIVNEKSPFSYLFKLILFWIHSTVFLSKKHLAFRYDLIHVHNIPDFLVFVPWLAKMTGAKIILDIHDIVPEFYAQKFSSGEKNLTYKILLLVERLSIAFSNHVIISNDIWYAKLVNRSVDDKKCTVILNYPDLSIFHKKHSRRKDDKCIILYPGSFNWHQGIDIAINAFALIKDQVPEAELHIYGDGSEKSTLMSLASKLNIDKKILFVEPLPINEISDAMANADIGIVPKRANFFGNEAFSTKILEFMAVGVPVIVTNTKIDKYYFNESIVKFFQSENEKDLAECLLMLIKNHKLRNRLIMNAFKYIEENSWEEKQNIYLDLVNSLI